MTLLTAIDKTNFINTYWQKRTLVFPQSFTRLENIVDGHELAGLACAEGVETRIVKGDTIEGDWVCEHGPFNDQIFATLPRRNWTLLVQGIDQWDDDIKQILDEFDFLPTWRLEDIMASYAPSGGSVGPHFDFYDVFLIQISGRREWQIGPNCDNTTELQNNQEVKLLSKFECEETHILSPGDMIYIPAGMAHWGKSLSDDCITFSVGFRAPSEKEIILEALEGLIQHFETCEEDNLRYCDSPASIDEDNNKINQTAHYHIDSALDKLPPELIRKYLRQAFGQLVTDPRYSPFDDDEEITWTQAELLELFNDCMEVQITHSSNSRFAYSDTQLFVNGDAFDATPSFSQSLCAQRISKPNSQAEINILLKLLNQQFIKL